jgi:hypothetical protein
MKPRAALITLSLLGSLGAGPPATQPSTDPADMKFMSADQVFSQMAKPATRPSRTLAPVPERDVQDRTGGASAVRPNAPQVPVIREGTLLVDRMGRLSHTDNGAAEFTFESDGKALQDPPMLLLPNQKLGELEGVVAAANRDLKFRVTGVVTEYKGRNYLLVEKYIVPIDLAQQF